MRNFFNRMPAWGWLAVALAMMIAGLWLAYFLVVNPPETPAGMVQTVPTFTATAAEPATDEPAASETPATDAATSDTDAAEADVQAVNAAPETVTEQVPATPAPTMPTPTEPAPSSVNTPLPPPTQTDTPLPDQRLALGVEQHRLGDYAAARGVRRPTCFGRYAAPSAPARPV